jgi:hypothetical protein
MGKYFCVVDGKAHDWKFTKSKANYDFQVWNFYLDETFIGQIFKAQRSGWDPVVHHTRCPFGGLGGFATRYSAAEYMLKVCGFIEHPDQLYKARLEDLGYVPVKFETYLDLVEAKDKLENHLSWVDNPERMGQ